jgi:cell division septation protein DedD
MSEPKDPEKLLADALRAQAVFAPSAERITEASTEKPVEPDTESNSGASAVPAAPAPSPSPSPGEGELPLQYGLLSGAGADSLERERVALEDAETARLAGRPTPPPAPSPSSAPLPAYWVLLLAALLGLAAGSVIGLLTLI